jgi:hypothetical protein
MLGVWIAESPSFASRSDYMIPTLLGLCVLVAEERKPVELVTNLIHEADEYTFKVTAPGVETVVRCRQTTNGEDTSWGGWRIVPYVLPIATTASGKGEVRVTFEFPGRKEPIVLRSRGLAEDVYLLKHLCGDKAAVDKWLDKVVPPSKTVVAWPENKAHEYGEFLEKVPAELAAAIKLGQDAYDAKRPELVRRLKDSFLFYAPAATMRAWQVSTGKNTLAIESGSADRMYFSRIRVELRKTDKGQWEVARIVAGEFFKGE